MATTTVGDVLLLLGDSGLDDRYPEGRDRFRRFLSQTKWDVTDLRSWIGECLDFGSRAQPQLYLALQDIITSVGHQLGMEVEYGTYGGSLTSLAYDGRWTLASGQTVLLEVKSSPWPLGSAGQLGRYMDGYCEHSGKPPTEVFGLFVIGSGDFQPVIDQIKGSDYRNREKVISFDDLLRLIDLARQLAHTGGQADLALVQNLLLPFESVNIGSLLDIITQVSYSRAEAVRLSRLAESHGRSADTHGRSLDTLPLDADPIRWHRSEMHAFLDACRPMQYALVMALAFSPQRWVELDRLAELMQAATAYVPGLTERACTPNTVGGARSGMSKRQRQMGKEPFILTRGTRYGLHERYIEWIREWLVEQGLVIPAELVVEGPGGEVYGLFGLSEPQGAAKTAGR